MQTTDSSRLRHVIAAAVMLVCVAASGPVPDFWKKGMVKPRVTSPRMAAVPLATPLVVVPLDTNMLRWTTMMPAIPVAAGYTITLNYPQWVWVQRCNDLGKNPPVWTNVWTGALPSNLTVDFISTAPRGVNPDYKFYLSFQNTN